METRRDFYEGCVYAMSDADFERIFGVKPADVQALDYDFERDVTWNYNLEYAYNEYCNESGFECE